MISVFTKLLTLNLSVIFAKGMYITSHQEFLGMVADSRGWRSSPSKVKAIIEIPRPTHVE